MKLCITPVKPTCCGASKAARLGFTLIELLVVIAIIAILAALLMGGLGRAKQLAKRTECLNTLRQWTIALQMYVDANGQVLPREGHKRNITGTVEPDMWAQVADPINMDVWYNTLPIELGKKAVGAYASKSSGARVLFYEDRLFHCPSTIMEPGQDADPYVYFSIALNSKLIQSYNASPITCSIMMSEIKAPSKTVSFLDAMTNEREYEQFKVDSWQKNWRLGQSGAYASRAAARHLTKVNMAFCDGHVASIVGKEAVSTTSTNRGEAIWPDGTVKWSAGDENPNLKGYGE